MIELIFVIVIMGILAKFGVEFLAQAYSSFIHSKINNELQSNSQHAVDFIASRLSYRIKPSAIARESNGTAIFTKVYEAGTAPILEWIAYDIEGYRGETWSGIIDLNSSKTDLNKLYSLKTDTAKIGSLINALSDGTADINGSAIYFVNRNPDKIYRLSDWGWDINDTLAEGKAIFSTQDGRHIHPVRGGANTSYFYPINANGSDNNFSGVEAYEYYKVAWTAYAVGIDNYDEKSVSNPDGTNTGDLTLWYDYQPWLGEDYNSSTTKKSIIVKNASSFQFKGSQTLINIDVCVKSLLIQDEEYSLCKNKIVY